MAGRLPQRLEGTFARGPKNVAEVAYTRLHTPASFGSQRMSEFRIERDSMGELKVPATALYSAQTQRAVDNFQIGRQPMPRAFIRALGLIKAACARANADLGALDLSLATAIAEAALEVADGSHDAHFPVDIYQTGSGTSSNMNANEVIATLASRALGSAVHPNDHVNMAQSSNDVIPTAIAVSAVLVAEQELLPALEHLRGTLAGRAAELSEVAKTGRTHLMDAMPVTFGQTLGAFVAQLSANDARLRESLERLRALPQGGTAVGTGINAPESFGAAVCQHLSALSNVRFVSAANYFEGIGAQDHAVEFSGQLNVLACTLMKLANDLRWMNSGPLAGLGEIELPALQPGSSIMPGKVNPVLPEATAMVSARVMGNHTTVTIAGQSGNFELNVMLPLIAHCLLESAGLLARVMVALADKAIAGFKVRHDNLARALHRNPILVTALNPVIGYEKGAAAAKRAYAEGRPIREVVLELTELPEAEVDRLLDPLLMTRGGVFGGSAGG